MTAAEIHAFKVGLLDDIHELSADPLGDADEIRRKVEEFFGRLEETIGEKGN